MALIKANIDNKSSKTSDSLIKDLSDELDAELGVDEAEEDVEDGETEGEIGDVEDETDVDQSENPDEEPQTQVSPKRQLTPAERVIVDQKKDLKELRAKIAQMQAAETAKTGQQQMETDKEKIKADLLKQDYDEDTAERMATTQVQLATLEKTTKTLMFERNNREVLMRYPESSGNIDAVFTAYDTMSKQGWSLEEVLRGRYGKTEPESEVRAKAAIKGEIGQIDDSASTSVTRASRAGGNIKSTFLSPAEQAEKEHIEAVCGHEITAKHFLEMKPRT